MPSGRNRTSIPATMPSSIALIMGLLSSLLFPSFDGDLTERRFYPRAYEADTEVSGLNSTAFFARCSLRLSAFSPSL